MSKQEKGPGPRMGEFAGTDRFRNPAFLAQGQLGVVYRVYDKHIGQDVALKTLPTLHADSLYYLKQEFRSLRGIQHPNLVRLYELHVEQDTCFFTMELIEGHPFTDSIWARYGKPSPHAGLSAPALTALRRALRQLARGVSALHRRDKLHRDIKPANVLVTPEGRVVLLDFDLVTRVEPEDEHNADHAGFNGTAQYMSPEQIYSKPLTPATDWYNVGVLLFETLSGRVPLDGTKDEIWQNLMSFTPPSLRELAPGTPEDLVELTRALLHQEPGRRAGERQIFAATWEAERVSSQVPLGLGDPLESAPLIGRAAEMDLLQQIYARTRREGAILVCIEGASGIGKTELVDSFLQTIQTKGNKALILRGTCDYQESVPFKAFDSLIDDLCRSLIFEQDRTAVPVPPHASALTRVFPVLGRIDVLYGAPPLDAAIAPQELRQLAFRALRELLAELARARPLILWIDDLQWGDADSALLFRELLRPPAAPELMLIVSYRSEDREGNVLLRSLASLDNTSEARVHKLSLGLLSPEESLALAAKLLPDQPGAPKVKEAKDIAEEAAGSPLFLIELARYVADGGTSERLNPLGGDRLKQILRQRIEILSAREQRILEVISVAGKQMTHSLVLQAAGLDEKGWLDILRLSQANLVRFTGLDERQEIEIYHDRFRQEILADMHIDRRRQYHRELAEALRSLPAPDPEALFMHYREAGYDRLAREYAQQAAANATRKLAFERAAELYEWLLKEGDPDSERAALLERLANALANAGRAEKAGDSFQAAAEELEQGPARLEVEVHARARNLRRQAAEQYLRGGYVEQGVKAVSEVLRAVDLDYPVSAWRAWISMLGWRTRLSLRGLEYKERSGKAIAASDLARIDACWSAGLGLGWIDRTRTAAFQARGMLLALDAGERSRVARALVSEASQLVSFGGAARRKRSEEVLEKARRLAHESDDPSLSAFLVLMEGSMAFYDARWRDALELCRDSLAMMREQSQALSWERTTAHLLSLGALTYLGELRELGRVLPALLAEAEARGDLISASSLASGLPNLLWLSLDQPEEARRRADKALERWAPDDFQFPHYLGLIARTQIDLYRGDGLAAWQGFRGTWPRVVASFLPIVANLRITLCHLQARAALAAATSRSERRHPLWDSRPWLLAVAKASAAWLEREEAKWTKPLALSVRAGVAAAEGKAQEAAAGLREAARQFEEVGMALYAAAARYQEGALAGGEVGRAAQQAGEAWMRDSGVVNPGRLTAMLVPGEELA